MKRIILISIWFVLFQASSQTNNYAVGDIVNNFTVTDTNGITYTLYDLTSQGKYVYIDFFYAACSSCQSKISIFNEFWDKYGCGQNEIFCIAINQGVDNNATVISFENQYGGSFNHAPAIASEGGATNITTLFGVNIFSTFCLIAPDNKLLVNNISPVGAVKHLEDALPIYFTPLPSSCSVDIQENINSIDPFVFIDNNRKLNIHFQTKTKFELSIYEITGKILYTDDFFESKIQLNQTSISSGVYFVKVLYNNTILVKKIIIEN